MINAIGNGAKVRGREMIGWFGLLNYREAVSYILQKTKPEADSYFMHIS
jgi:hypothetical protein